MLQTAERGKAERQGGEADTEVDMIIACNHEANQRREHGCSPLEGGEKRTVIVFMRPDWATVLRS